MNNIFECWTEIELIIHLLRSCYGFFSIGRSDFGVEFIDMSFDGAKFDEKFGSYFFIGFSFSYELEDLFFFFS